MTRVLLICGSLRAESTNAAALRTVAALAQDGTDTVLYEGMAALPHFNPDDDVEGATPHPGVADLRRQIAEADAILFCTPEYAGALPGALKNLLEWTIGDGGTYGKPVAWINVSGPAAPTGGADAHDSLRKVLTYSGASIVESACVRVPLVRQAIGVNGLVSDAGAREHLAGALARLAASAPAAASPPR
ncbi:MAG TPA: NAD(P)H-dependent oxidoreductase [Thermoleophilaceae bacterium]